MVWYLERWANNGIFFLYCLESEKKMINNGKYFRYEAANGNFTIVTSQITENISAKTIT
ncbi:hypothetical protein J2Z37_001004 [Ammoniphilus resinae]|uniref:Uncharacterized protein n=1 Tax=Ammoniphilus resinae TaxID=861532 RepID=A0ABS4GL73_9BACL|nr:hypothetical protein [Ammoniphilus resinae]